MSSKKRHTSSSKSSNANAAKAKKSSSKKKQPIAPTRVYTLVVKLITNVDPNTVVSRTIQIRGDQTLFQLHEAIFSAFDRGEEHLIEFRFGVGSDPDFRGTDIDEFENWEAKRRSYFLDDGIEPPCDFHGYVEKVTMDSLQLRTSEEFLYWFDFGDNWWHSIRVTGIVEAEEAGLPKVIASVGASPPQYGEEQSSL